MLLPHHIKFMHILLQHRTVLLGIYTCASRALLHKRYPPAIFTLVLSLSTFAAQGMEPTSLSEKPKLPQLRQCVSMNNLTPFGLDEQHHPQTSAAKSVRKSHSGPFYTTIGKKYATPNSSLTVCNLAKKIKAYKNTKTDPVLYHGGQDSQSTSPDFPQEEIKALSLTRVPSDLDLNNSENTCNTIVCKDTQKEIDNHQSDNQTWVSLFGQSSLILLDPPPHPTLPLDVQWITKTSLPEQIPHYLTLQLCKEMGRELDNYFKSLPQTDARVGMPVQPFKISINLDEVETWIKKKITQELAALANQTEDKLKREINQLKINNSTLLYTLTQCQKERNDLQEKSQNLTFCNQEIAQKSSQSALEVALGNSQYNKLLLEHQTLSNTLQEERQKHIQEVLNHADFKKRCACLGLSIVTLNFLGVCLLYQILFNTINL